MRKKEEKINASNKETHRIRTKSIEEINAKDFLSITEASQMLSVSRWTIWRAIKRNDLNAGKIGTRTIIRRSYLDKLFI